MSPDQQIAYRRALGAFATGVCVMTAQTAEGPLGLTVNSFTSVSLTPPLVLWCLDETSARWPAFAAADHFAVHVLGADDRAVSERFSRGICLLSPDEFTPGLYGAPLLDTAIARLQCLVRERVQLGDHLVVVGEVEAHEARPGDGLVFFRGRYGRAPEDPA